MATELKEGVPEGGSAGRQQELRQVRHAFDTMRAFWERMVLAQIYLVTTSFSDFGRY